MKNGKHDTPHAEGRDDLRKQAEERLRETPAGEVSSHLSEGAARLLHELQVHQIELEIQNEELRASREATEAALEQYSDLYDFAPVGYFTCDSQGQVIEANLAAAKFAGVERSRLINAEFASFVASDDRGAFKDFLEGLARGEAKRTGEVALRSNGGPFVYVRLDGVAVELRGGDAPSYRVGMTDITERKHADQALRERAARLRALASELTLAEQRERRRVAQVLHDNLQQLLVGAKHRAMSLLKRNDPAHREVVADVCDLIEQSLAVSQTLTGELGPPVLREGGLVPALQWLVHWKREKLGLEIVLSVAGSLDPLKEDVAAFLFQSVRELLLNVHKHARVNAARVEVSLTNGDVRIVVADAGAGFDPAQIWSQNGTATGFGLFQMKERLELLGGRLALESVPGHGSQFTLVVPKAEALATAARDVGAELFRANDAQTPPARSPVSGTAAGKIRVLLVDDHKVLRQLLVLTLRDEPDIEVVGEADDGKAAIALTRELVPHVVVMDITMPGMSGIEATRIIHAELPETRIIGLSMFSDEDMAETMREAGACDYVSKSGPFEAVVDAIRASAGPLLAVEGS